ncbi:MAG: ABC transporter permease, partial [Luteolibacter sp.]
MGSTSACPAADHGLASGIKRRSFSLLLARRYLNPRRSMLSSFSIISLLGVMLGVLVLVVVMAIYAGLERNVKSRLLGFTPHVSANFHDPASLDGRMTNWQEAAARLKTLPDVEAATAFVSDNVIIDYQTWQRPVLFRGIDTSDPAQVEGIAKMLDLQQHPGSTADLGIDDRVVISSILAEQLQIGVGDEIRLLSTRNIEGVMRAYKSTENPLVRDAFKDSWTRISGSLTSAWKPDGDGFTLTFETYREIYPLIDGIIAEDIRTPERTLLESILIAMDSSEKDDASGLFRFTTEAKVEIEKSVAALNATDMESMDAKT